MIISRYRPVGTPIYSMTELLHHSRSLAELIELRPGVRYEASLILIPPPTSVTELFDPTTVEFTTLPYIGLYLKYQLYTNYDIVFLGPPFIYSKSTIYLNLFK